MTTQGQSDSSITRRRTNFLSNGLYWFEDELHVRGLTQVPLIRCTAWLIEVYDLKGGAIAFPCGNQRAPVRRRSCAVLYPPFGMTEVRLENAVGRVAGIAGTAPLPIGAPTIATVFDLTWREFCSHREQPEELLRVLRNPQAVELNPQASALSQRAKRLLDRSYRASNPISGIARQLGVSLEHLSRQFKRDFGMSPRQYLHALRLADAPLLLARDEEIARVAHDVGYNELSRFYTQFRKRTKTSPAVCRAMVKPRSN